MTHPMFTIHSLVTRVQMKERRERVSRWQAVRKLKSRTEVPNGASGDGDAADGAGAAVDVTPLADVDPEAAEGGGNAQDGWSSDEDEKLAQEGT